MTTEESTTPIHAFVRSDVVRSAFVSPLEASGWAMAALRDSTDLAALLRDAPYAVLLVDSAAAPPMPGPWIQGLFVGSGEAPDGLAARPFSTPVGQLAADLRRLAFTAQLAALRAGRVHQARGFLEDVPLRSCLAALVGRKSSGTVRFSSARGEGCIYLREGRVIDVEVASLRGEEALARLLAWTEGNVHVAEGTVLGDALITRPTDDVFAEAERMAAAVAASLVLLPKAGVPLELERFVASRIVPRPSEDLEKLLNLIDGKRDIIALLDASPFDDASTARTLARFAQGGALRAVGTTAQVEDVAPPSVALVARHTPANLPQVTLQMDAPKVPAPEPHVEEVAPAPPSASVEDDGQPVGATTPVGLFAVGGPESAKPSSRPLDATPLTPGVEALQTATSAAVEAPMRRTPISVETPAKAALDAAFRKAAQESQAVMTASESYTATSSRRSVPAPVNDRAMRLVGGIGIAAVALFAVVALKGALGGSPAPAAPPARVEAVAAAPAPKVEELAPAPAAPAAEPEVPSPGEAETATSTAAAAPAAPAAAAAPPVGSAPVAAAPAASTSSAVPAVKLPPGRLQKAKDFLDQGNYVSASVEAQAVIQGDPTQAEGWLVLGASAQAQGKDSEAKRYYSECARRGRGPSVEECRQLLAQ